MRLRLLIAFVAVAVALLPGGAAAQNREHLQLNADLRMSQEQVGRLQLTVNQLAERLVTTDGRIDEAAATNLKSFADQKLVIDQITGTLSTMREKLDDNTTRVSQLTQEFSQVREGLRLLTDQINALVSILQPAVNPDDPDALSTAPGATPGLLGAVTMPESPAMYLTEAMNHYFASRWDLAIEAFEEIVEKFPGTPQAANAQLQLGQSYYQQGKYREAIPHYQRLITTYTQSEHLPEAYLMQGLCYEGLDQRTNARKMFQQVIDLYPESQQAIQAEQRLKRN
jgi:tol-pal system protein YbgF